MRDEHHRAPAMLAMAWLCGLSPACGTSTAAPTHIQLVDACERYESGGLNTHGEAVEAGAIAVDAKNVYWSTGQCGSGPAVMAIPIKGGHTRTLVSGTEPLALAIDETGMYWVEKWAVMKVPLVGGPTTQLAALSFPAATIALDETSVYYAEDGKTFSISKNGDEGSTIVASAVAMEDGHQFPTAVAVSPNGVFWAQTDGSGNGGVFFQSSNDRATTMIAHSDDPKFLVADGAHVYWADSRMDRILGASADNGSADEIDDDALVATGLALDDDYVYWTAKNRTVGWDVRRGPRRGGASTLLATVYEHPGGLAVDSTGVYWTDEFGAVTKATLK